MDTLTLEAPQQLGVGAAYGFLNGKLLVETHNNFNGTRAKTVQGETIASEYDYETFRIVGFSAIVEQHLTLGLGYEFSDRLSLNLGYMHAFAETITETGTDLFGQAVTIESTLSEDSLDFGITWRF